MTKSSLKKWAVLLTTIISLSWGTVALANSYTSSLSFDTTLTGPSRWFDGQNIVFEASIVKSVPYSHGYNFTYKVALYRNNKWDFDDKIGEAVLLRDNPARVEWSNVGPGNYYLFFSKANDGISLQAETVRIYSY